MCLLSDNVCRSLELYIYLLNIYEFLDQNRSFFFLTGQKEKLTPTNFLRQESKKQQKLTLVFGSTPTAANDDAFSSVTCSNKNKFAPHLWKKICTNHHDYSRVLVYDRN